MAGGFSPCFGSIRSALSTPRWPAAARQLSGRTKETETHGVDDQPHRRVVTGKIDVVAEDSTSAGDFVDGMLARWGALTAQPVEPSQPTRRSSG